MAEHLKLKQEFVIFIIEVIISHKLDDPTIVSIMIQISKTVLLLLLLLLLMLLLLLLLLLLLKSSSAKLDDPTIVMIQISKTVGPGDSI